MYNESKTAIFVRTSKIGNLEWHTSLNLGIPIEAGRFNIYF